MKEVVIAGGTGYIGRPLIEQLCGNGYRVKAIARPKSVSRVPKGCELLVGNVLDAATYQEEIAPARPLFISSECRIPLPGKVRSFERSILSRWSSPSRRRSYEAWNTSYT